MQENAKKYKRMQENMEMKKHKRNWENTRRTFY